MPPPDDDLRGNVELADRIKSALRLAEEQKFGNV